MIPFNPYAYQAALRKRGLVIGFWINRQGTKLYYAGSDPAAQTAVQFTASREHAVRMFADAELPRGFTREWA